MYIIRNKIRVICSKIRVGMEGAHFPWGGGGGGSIITHEDYKSTLLQKAYKTHTMMQIRSFGHQLYTVKLNKTSLSPYDDKRYILDNGCDTFAQCFSTFFASRPKMSDCNLSATQPLNTPTSVLYVGEFGQHFSVRIITILRNIIKNNDEIYWTNLVNISNISKSWWTVARPHENR